LPVDMPILFHREMVKRKESLLEKEWTPALTLSICPK